MKQSLVLSILALIVLGGCAGEARERADAGATSPALESGAGAPIVSADAQTISPVVDERVELLSIVYRLAAVSEFVAARPSPYSRAVDRHFARYARHPLIAYVRELNESLAANDSEVSGWDVLSLAVHLDATPALNPLVPYDDATTIDNWDSRILLRPEMVSLLRQFYRDAECARFFESQAAYFRAVNRAVDSQGVNLNSRWLERFFAVPTSETYRPVLSLLGIADFGYIRVNFGGERRDTYTIFAVSAFDQTGMPSALDYQAVARSNLHESIHTYANQLVDRNIASLRAPAESLLARPAVWARVQDTFYNNAPFLMRESLVRASAIKYAEENGGGAEAREREIAAQERAGFVWMRGLVEQLDAYERDRAQHADLAAFMPHLIDFFEQAARQ